MIGLTQLYILAGAIFAAFAMTSALDATNPKRFGSAAFWGLMAVSFLFGSYIGDIGNGVLVLALVALGGFKLLGHGKPATTTPEERRASAAKRGNWLFAPALVIPATALAGTLFLKQSPLFDPKQITLVFLGIGVVLSLAISMLWLRPPLAAPLTEGTRLADSIGWAAILPQMLASLGAVFALAGVGKAVGHVATDYLPLGQPFEAVAAFCIGMALFTIVMGNAFAAFPVMTAAIGLPLIVHKFHGDPVIMGAIGMLAGYCGTLVTPMAANFNIVPAALLDLPDRNAVIKAQAPTAIPLLIGNIVLMYYLVFRF
ncbi:MAG TPA: DUF979 domain-containing protein [Rhizomicrobium sp.]|jgi:uncharacterized membrane protein|nr:DUF979 domain-containing protein [Rhizomicrobium sp.]